MNTLSFALFLYVAIFCALVCLNYLVAKKFEQIAFMKGYGRESHPFVMCFWLGIVGYLYVIALPDLNARR